MVDRLNPQPAPVFVPSSRADYCRLARYSLGISRGTCFEMGLIGPEALTQAIRLRGIIRKGNEARCPKNAGDGPLFARSIYEVAAHRRGSHNQEIPRCGCRSEEH